MVDFVVIYTLALIVALTFALIIIRMIKKNNQKEITEGLFRLTKIDITYKATTMQFGYFKQIDTGLTNEGESNEVDSSKDKKLSNLRKLTIFSRGREGSFHLRIRVRKQHGDYQPHCVQR